MQLNVQPLLQNSKTSKFVFVMLLQAPSNRKPNQGGFRFKALLFHILRSQEVSYPRVGSVAQCHQQGRGSLCCPVLPSSELLPCPQACISSTWPLQFQTSYVSPALSSSCTSPFPSLQLLLLGGTFSPSSPTIFPLRYCQPGSCTPAVRDSGKQVSSASSFVGEGGFWQPGRRAGYWLLGRPPTVAITELKVHRKCVCQDSLSSKGQKSSSNWLKSKGNFINSEK